jgi:hypothetical protein
MVPRHWHPMGAQLIMRAATAWQEHAIMQMPYSGTATRRDQSASETPRSQPSRLKNNLKTALDPSTAHY